MSSAPRARFNRAAILFRGLADPVRLAIVHLLARKEASVADLVADLGLAQSTVSQHLAYLRESGLVAVRREGRMSRYRLRRPEVMQWLAAAEPFVAPPRDVPVSRRAAQFRSLRGRA